MIYEVKKDGRIVRFGKWLRERDNFLIFWMVFNGTPMGAWLVWVALQYGVFNILIWLLLILVAFSAAYASGLMIWYGYVKTIRDRP